MCKEGPARVMELVQMGASFTCNQDGSLHLTKEGGHSSRRIVHAADMTGQEIERALLATAHAHPNIQFQVCPCACACMWGGGCGGMCARACVNQARKERPLSSLQTCVRPL